MSTFNVSFPKCTGQHKKGKDVLELIPLKTLKGKEHALQYRREGACKFDSENLALYVSSKEKDKSLAELKRIREGIRKKGTDGDFDSGEELKRMHAAAPKTTWWDDTKGWIRENPGTFGGIVVAAAAVVTAVVVAATRKKVSNYRFGHDGKHETLEALEVKKDKKTNTDKVTVIKTLGQVEVNVFRVIQTKQTATVEEIHAEVLRALEDKQQIVSEARIKDAVKELKKAKLIAKGKEKKYSIRKGVTEYVTAVPTSPAPDQKVYKVYEVTDSDEKGGPIRVVVKQGDKEIGEYVGWQIPALEAASKQPTPFDQIAQIIWPIAQQQRDKDGQQVYLDQFYPNFVQQLRDTLVPYQVGEDSYHFDAVDEASLTKTPKQQTPPHAQTGQPVPTPRAPTPLPKKPEAKKQEPDQKPVPPPRPRAGAAQSQPAKPPASGRPKPPPRSRRSSPTAPTVGDTPPPARPSPPARTSMPTSVETPQPREKAVQSAAPGEFSIDVDGLMGEEDPAKAPVDPAAIAPTVLAEVVTPPPVSTPAPEQFGQGPKTVEMETVPSGVEQTDMEPSVEELLMRPHVNDLAFGGSITRAAGYGVNADDFKAALDVVVDKYLRGDASLATMLPYDSLVNIGQGLTYDQVARAMETDITAGGYGLDKAIAENMAKLWVIKELGEGMYVNDSYEPGQASDFFLKLAEVTTGASPQLDEGEGLPLDLRGRVEHWIQYGLEDVIALPIIAHIGGTIHSVYQGDEYAQHREFVRSEFDGTMEHLINGSSALAASSLASFELDAAIPDAEYLNFIEGLRDVALAALYYDDAKEGPNMMRSVQIDEAKASITSAQKRFADPEFALIKGYADALAAKIEKAAGPSEPEGTPTGGGGGVGRDEPIFKYSNPNLLGQSDPDMSAKAVQAGADLYIDPNAAAIMAGIHPAELGAARTVGDAAVNRPVMGTSLADPNKVDINGVDIAGVSNAVIGNAVSGGAVVNPRAVTPRSSAPQSISVFKSPTRPMALPFSKARFTN